MLRIISLILALSIIASMLTACFPFTIERPLSSTPAQNNSSADDENPTDISIESDQTVAVATEESKPTTATLAEIVIFDVDGIKITATGIDDRSFYGKQIKFLVENNTDRNIVFSGDNFAVNGITIHGYLYIAVAAGKKANGVLEFYGDHLDAAHIRDLATVVAKDTHIHDSDTYKTICDVPFTLNTSISDSYTQTIVDDGDIIFNQAGVIVIAQVIGGSFYGEAVHLLVKNNTGKDIIVDAANISVNGFTVNAWLYDTIYADTIRYCELDLFSGSLEENGIEDIEEVTFTLRIIDHKSYSEITHSDELAVYVVE